MIKAIFPEGVNNITAHGLHQWDYGQQLEIQAADLPALVEVHFAYEGMREAVVRACAVTNNVAVAAIPDQCLAQSSPVFAWVYVVDGTEGSTVKTVTMPVIARTQPQTVATDPEEYSDKYTEAVTAMNALLAYHESTAELAEYAKTAGSAESADHATTAATLTPSKRNTSPTTYAAINSPGLYVAVVNPGLTCFTGEGTYYGSHYGTGLIAIHDLSATVIVQAGVQENSNGTVVDRCLRYTPGEGLCYYNHATSKTLTSGIVAVYCIATFN
jgi:hypothetical protein